MARRGRSKRGGGADSPGTRDIEGRPLTPAGKPLRGRNRLLFIAIGRYETWPGLPGPATDVAKVKGVLLERYVCDDDCVEELPDEKATRKGILTAFERLKDEARPEDSVLVWYAGHGYTDPSTGVGFWIPHDGGHDRLERERWIANQEVRGYMRAFECAHVLLVSDSCFSGDLLDPQRTADVVVDRDSCARAHALRSREVLTSGASEPVSDSSLGGMSPFAFHFVDTLRRNEEAYLTAVTICDHVSRGVTGQMPLLGPLEGAGHQRGGSYLFFLKAPAPVAHARPAASVVPAAPKAEVFECAICGRRNPLADTFRCRGCGRDHLCARHLDEEANRCSECLERAAREAEEKRRAEEEEERRHEEARWKADREAALAGRLERIIYTRWPFDPKEARRRQEETAGITGLPVDWSLDLGGGVKLELVLIPASEFMMGSPEDEEDRSDDEGPVHRVRITRAFYMGKHEVTQAQYQAVTGTNPSRFKGSDLPVEQVSWNDATEFCRKLTAKCAEVGIRRYPAAARPEPTISGGDAEAHSRRVPTSGATLVVRLPREAEWEYACRAGTSIRFYFGDSDGGLGEYAWFSYNSDEQTHDVGGRRPHAWGLHDMHGNVWEWCADWCAAYPSGTVTDPTGPANGNCRVLRGGSWNAKPLYCRCAYRLRFEPSSRNDCLGFRVAASASAGR